MALGWVVVLTLLGMWPGAVNEEMQPPLQEKMGRVVLQSERFQQEVQQAQILGQSV